MASTFGADRDDSALARESGSMWTSGDDRMWLAFNSANATPPLSQQFFWRAYVLGVPVYSYGSVPPGLYPALVSKECGDLPTYTVSTANATPTILWSQTLPDFTALTIRVAVTAETVGGGGRATYNFIGFAYRNGGGATLGTTVVLKQEESNMALDADFFVSGNDAQLMVTGLAMTNINWTAVVEAVAAT